MLLELLILPLEFGQRLGAFTLIPLSRQTCCRERKREEGSDPAVCEVSVMWVLPISASWCSWVSFSSRLSWSSLLWSVRERTYLVCFSYDDCSCVIKKRELCSCARCSDLLPLLLGLVEGSTEWFSADLPDSGSNGSWCTAELLFFSTPPPLYSLLQQLL